MEKDSDSFDDVWTHHCYLNVEQSTGFGEYLEKTPTLSEEQWALVEAMQSYYDELAKLRIYL